MMSTRSGLNLFLLLVLGAVLWLAHSLGQRQNRRAVEYLPEMIFAVSAESYSRAAALPGGMVEQKPVEGTISRGSMPLHLEPGADGAARAAAELTNPIDEGDQSALERGGEIFRTYCLLCHGPGGAGDGPVAQRGFPAPPSLLAPQAQQMSDGQLFHIASVGQGNMPGHAGQIDPLDRWRAVLRIRQLQAAAPPGETVLGEGP